MSETASSSVAFARNSDFSWFKGSTRSSQPDTPFLTWGNNWFELPLSSAGQIAFKLVKAYSTVTFRSSKYFCMFPKFCSVFSFKTSTASTKLNSLFLASCKCWNIALTHRASPDSFSLWYRFINIYLFIISFLLLYFCISKCYDFERQG